MNKENITYITALYMIVYGVVINAPLTFALLLSLLLSIMFMIMISSNDEDIMKDILLDKMPTDNLMNKYTSIILMSLGIFIAMTIMFYSVFEKM